jgi:hypothetical protein
MFMAHVSQSHHQVNQLTCWCGAPSCCSGFGKVRNWLCASLPDSIYDLDPPIPHPYDQPLPLEEEQTSSTRDRDAVQESPPAPMRWIPPEHQVQQQYMAEAVVVGKRPGDMMGLTHTLDPAVKDSIEICLRTTVKVRRRSRPNSCPCVVMTSQTALTCPCTTSKCSKCMCWCWQEFVEAERARLASENAVLEAQASNTHPLPSKKEREAQATA